MSDDAEKKIARLMREGTTSGESKDGLGKHSVSGQSNFVVFGDVIVSLNLHPTATTEFPSQPQKNLETPPASSEVKKRILERCASLGDESLYRPFIQTVFKKTEIESLAGAELRRLQVWLGIAEIP